MNRFLNRISIVLMSALLLLTGFIPAQAEGEDFEEFLKQEWKEMMDDYVTMHYSVKDYQAEGLTKPDVNLGEVSYEEYARLVEERKASLDHLHQFDYESLDERQKIDYLVYEENLNNDIAVFSYPNFKEMFNPYSGVHSDLTTTFTEFTFYTKDDIDDYLILADDYDRYVDEMIEFTRKQAEQGYFMRDVALDVQLCGDERAAVVHLFADDFVILEYQPPDESIHLRGFHLRRLPCGSKALHVSVHPHLV